MQIRSRDSVRSENAGKPSTKTGTVYNHSTVIYLIWYQWSNHAVKSQVKSPVRSLWGWTGDWVFNLKIDTIIRKITLRLVIWPSLVLFRWTTNKGSWNWSLILRRRPPKPYKSLKSCSFVTPLKYCHMIPLQRNWVENYYVYQFVSISQKWETFWELIWFWGRCLKIRDV